MPSPRPGLKARALQLSQRLFSGWGGGGLSQGFGLTWLWGALPGSQAEWEKKAGPLHLNGAISICLGWLVDNFVEPELAVYRRKADGVQERLSGHGLVELVANPNPHYDGDTLWAGTLVSYALHGNAYWFCARDQGGLGAVRELYWLPHWRMRPLFAEDGTDYLSGWAYTVSGAEQVFRREDVLHFRCGMDPENERLGMSRLRALLREVCTDNQASAFTAALLENMGVPGVVFSPATPEGKINRPQAEQLQAQWEQRVTGDGRGKPFIAGGPIKIEKLTFSPEELALDKIRQVPEARICAALRVPAMVAGLNVGDQQKTYSNYGEARTAAYEDCLQPIGRRFARTLSRFLLPDFERDPQAAGLSVGWDYGQIAALQEDRDKLYKRATLGYQGGILKRSEGRALVGLKSDPADEEYYSGPANAELTKDDKDPPAAGAAAKKSGPRPQPPASEREAAPDQEQE